MRDLYTPWGETLDKSCPLPEYPRPQLKRESYLNLNGVWNYTVQDGEGMQIMEVLGRNMAWMLKMRR